MIKSKFEHKTRKKNTDIAEQKRDITDIAEVQLYFNHPEAALP